MKNKAIKYLAILLCAILFALGLVYVYHNLTLGFAVLFIVLILFMAIPLFINERKTRKNDDSAAGPRIVFERDKKERIVTRSWLPLLCALLILVFGGLSLFVLENYFNASPEVYKNYQHHALRIDGVKIDREPFALASDRGDAFWDNPTLSGTIHVVQHDSNGVQLSLRGVTQPLYQKKYYPKRFLKEEEQYYDCLNTASMVSFQATTPDADEWVRLVSTELDTQGNPKELYFRIVEGHESGKIIDLQKKKVMSHPQDTLLCYFKDGPASPANISSFHHFILSSYSLEGISSDITTSFDMRGINIVRGECSIMTKRPDVYKRYVQSRRPYYLEIQSDAKLAYVQVGDGPQVPVETMRRGEVSVTIPYNKTIFIGTGTNKSEFVRFVQRKDSTLVLSFEQPKYQFLSSVEDASESTMMVTTSILEPDSRTTEDSGLLDNLTDNILRFDIFNRNENGFQISPFYVSFVSGPTSRKMSFSVLTEDSDNAVNGIKAGTEIENIHSRNGVEWVVQVEDFKETTPFQSTRLCWWLLLITLLCAFSMVLSFGAIRLYTPYEYAVYLLIIGFLAVRFFLLWRVTVFPPVSSISRFEFNHFRYNHWMKGWASFALWTFGALLLVVNLVKLGVLLYVRRTRDWRISDWLQRRLLQVKKVRKREKKQGKKQNTRTGWFLMVLLSILVIYIVVYVLVYGLGSTLLTIVVPPTVYLLLDALIYGFVGPSYDEDVKRARFPDRTRRYEAVGERADAFLVSIWNMLLASGTALVLDGGYGVMFLLFVCMSFLFKITDLIQYTIPSSDGSKKRMHICWYILLLLLFVLVCGYKWLFITLFDSILKGKAILFFLAAGVSILILSALLFAILDIKIQKKHIWLPIAIAVVCALGCLLSSGVRGSHMEYRTRVHMEEAGEILCTVDSPSAYNKFQQASLNDWILHEYYAIGKDIHGFGEHGNGYFKIQPQSKVGAMWFAQTTDISIARYIIAEHGRLLPWLFVFAYIILILISLKTSVRLRWTKIIVVQVALLFALQSLMILLSNTRAFIFFGQDFPLISLTSHVSCLYFFALMMIGVVAALIGKASYNYPRKDSEDFFYEDKEESYVSRKDMQLSAYLFAFFFISALALYFTGRSHLNEGRGGKSKSNVQIEGIKGNPLDFGSIAFYKERTYDLDSLIGHINGQLQRYVNPCFVSYQETHGVPELQRNMSEYVAGFFQDSTFQSVLANDCSALTRNMLENFRGKGSKSNSANNVICLRNNRSYEAFTRNERSIIIPHDTLEFVTGLRPMKYELPQKVKNSWKGSIVEQAREPLPQDACIDNSHGSYSSVFIPGRFTGSGEPVQLVRARGARSLKLVGSDVLIAVRQDSVSVVNVKKEDYLISGNRTIRELPLSTSRYFARNLLMNGKRTFIYPYGQKMLWARNVAAYNNSKLSPDDGDVPITVNPDLTVQLYNKYLSKLGAGDRSVIVADGNGAILAMVDFRGEKEYRLNPNDFRQVGRIEDSLYLKREKGRTTETRYFGNFAQNYLRCGPGSSQKPLLWTAVTTMYNTGWWGELKLAGIRKHQSIGDENYGDFANYDGTYYRFRRYVGNPIETRFKSRAGDEGDGGLVNISTYMSKSSNFYNSLMAYIGSFRQSDFVNGFGSNSGRLPETKDGSSLFYRPSVPRKPARLAGQSVSEYQARLRDYASKYNNLFPLMTFSRDNDGPVVAFNRFLDKDRLTDTLALAPMGLYRNLGLYYKYSKNPSIEVPYSHFDLSVRLGRTQPRELNEYMVRSVAIGSNTAWLVSPAKMAEMYGRMISFNNNYTLSIYPQDPLGWSSLYLDSSWSNGYSSYLPVRKELLKGMSHVFKDGTASTFSDMLDKTYGDSRYLRIDDGESRRSGQSLPRQFYIYGKTGTMDGIWGGVKLEDHMLATIITDAPITSCTEEELKDVNFIVIYQVDYHHKALDKNRNRSTWANVDEDIVRAVMSSDAFKKYFGIR